MVSILLLKLIHLMLGLVGKTSLPNVIGPFWSKVGRDRMLYCGLFANCCSVFVLFCLYFIGASWNSGKDKWSSDS